MNIQNLEKDHPEIVAKNDAETKKNNQKCIKNLEYASKLRNIA